MLFYIKFISGSDCKVVCGVPGVGASVNNSCKDPSKLWEVKQASVAEDNLKTRLLKIFKSSYWKRELKRSDSKLKSPFTFPKLKVIKDDPRVTNDSERLKNNNRQNNSLKRGKSLPVEKSPTACEVPQILQVDFSVINMITQITGFCCSI